MQRRSLLARAAAVLAAAPAAVPRGAAAQPRNPGWPQALTMGTAAPGGTYALYGPAWGQLAQYDPENFFRMNHNIRPTA